jgi:hypothetical protein
MLCDGLVQHAARLTHVVVMLRQFQLHVRVRVFWAICGCGCALGERHARADAMLNEPDCPRRISNLQEAEQAVRFCVPVRGCDTHVWHGVSPV